MNTATVAYMDGVLNIDKPEGITSHDVVDRVRKVTNGRQVGLPAEARRKRAKVGHAGTLDPFATGVLIVAVGNATRLLDYAHDLPKTYQATFMLGATSDTDDKTGTIQAGHASPPTESKVIAVLQEFIGPIEQIPPAYSAIKIQGKKLYELARAGKPVAAKPRQVTIFNINVLSYAYPRLAVEITCGSGTYIRAIARDLGEKLGVGAYVEELRRTAIGNFAENKAVPLGQLTTHNGTDHLQPPEALVAHLPRVTLSDAQVIDIKQGKAVPISHGQTPPTLPLSGEGLVAVFDKDEKLIGIGKIKNSALKPEKVLLH